MAEKTCSKCSEVNEVEKSYNCSKCRFWNKFDSEEGLEEVAEDKPKKKGKKWLS